MDIVDKSGKKTDDKVIITDIAKASEVGDVSQIDTDLKNKDGSPTTAIDAINHVNTKSATSSMLRMARPMWSPMATA